MIELGKISAGLADDVFRIELPVTRNGETEPCWFSLPAAYRPLVAEDRADSFVLSLLLPAMAAGEDIHCSSPVSEQLLLNLNGELIPALAAFNPADYRLIRVTAESTLANDFGASGVGCGFSGGIDSFSAIVHYLVRPPSERFRITHLFFFNVGSHGMAGTPSDLLRIREKFMARYRTLKPFADECGLPFIPVDSNIHALRGSPGHLEACSIVTPAAGLLFQKGLHKYLLSSCGYDHSEAMYFLRHIARTNETEVIDSWLMPYLSTESTEVRIADPGMKRFDKVAELLDYEPVRRYLNVCGNRETIDTNCSVCEKCCRTLATLDVLGRIGDFSGRFDLRKYRARGERPFLAKMFAERRDEPLYEDIIRHAERAGVPLKDRITLYDRLRYRFIDSRLHRFLRGIGFLREWVRKIKAKRLEKE